MAYLPVSPDIDITHWNNLKPYYDELSVVELTRENIRPWLKQWSDFSDATGEAGTWMHVKVSCDTTDKAAEEKLLNFEKDVEPLIKKAENDLIARFIDAGHIPADMTMAAKNLGAYRELFRVENLPLETEISKLCNDYGKIQGEWLAEFDGRKMTREELARLQEEPDRDLRERSMKVFLNRYLEDREKIDNLYDQMCDLRMKIAKNAGFDRYTEFRFKEFTRFDYTPQDCITFHEAVEKTMVPLSAKITELRRRELGIDTMKPWDAKVDWMGDGPLKPFTDTHELSAKVSKIFHRLAPDLAGHFDKMREKKWLDLDSRPGKRAGGYCTSLSQSKGAFIFMNAAQTGQDIFTLAHEAGHSFHDFECMDALDLSFQHNMPIEFAEVASMSMEMMIYPYLDEFYAPADAARARLGHLCEIVQLFGYVCAIDAFQHWVYANPDAGHAARDAQSKALHERLCPDLNWTGFEASLESMWQRKLHVMLYPFYYIDYAMAQIGALQVWKNSLKDEKAAIKAYTNALRLGGTASRPELFKAAGAEFRFDLAMLQDLAGLLETKINEELAAMGKKPLAV